MGFNLKAFVCLSRHTLTFKKLEAVPHLITLGLKPGGKFPLQRSSEANELYITYKTCRKLTLYSEHREAKVFLLKADVGTNKT